MNQLRIVSIISLTIISLTTRLLAPLVIAADVRQIDAQGRFDSSGTMTIDGKETDWITGDYLLANDQIIAVIARPINGRDANMTVRDVGAAVIDLTRRDDMSDQLSAFYPGGGRYRFTDDSQVEFGKLPDGAYWRCSSSSSVQDNGTTATVEYRLGDQDDFLTVTVTITGEQQAAVNPFDGVRADRTFRFGVLPATAVAFFADDFFRQAYGVETSVGGTAPGPPSWGDDRLKQLIYAVPAADTTVSANELSPAGQLNATADPASPGDQWTARIYPASSLVDLWGLTQGAAAQEFQLEDGVGQHPRYQLTVVDDLDGKLTPAIAADGATWRCDSRGHCVTHLPAGRYRIRAEAIGHQPTERTIEVTAQPGRHVFSLGQSSAVEAIVRDQDGAPIPFKMTINGSNVDDPSFGPDSADGSVGNCVYSTSGEVTRSLPPGRYEVVISHGPEYNAVFREVEVGVGEPQRIAATLERVVDTSGWVSAELHSHSSPSGDNTSSQLGRVENLVCEHLEFAPCTEHQRIDSYDDQLEILGATRLMATCSGMELTGSPLPINHQNAFPLRSVPMTQSGGGPRTDTNPVVQIQRLAMWDDGAAKVVQGNHPTFPQLLRDRDLDGRDDGGFASMLDYMDVIEVHPPEDIFAEFADQPADEAQRNRMHHWMQLIKSGRRIPGVVNTDAHYNWHGSGALRNWVQSSTDDPAEIKIEEMIEHLEQGQIIMSTGPFMSVQLLANALDQPAEVGNTVDLINGEAELAIQVQCPNWLDVNRVDVFIGGERQPQLTQTRRTHPASFGDGVVKFDQRIPIDVAEDTFVIVAAIGEGLNLQRVMGAQYGNRPPVVVSNPIYVRVTGVNE